MKYKGIELKEFTSDKPVVFDPPKKMFVCNKAELLGDANIEIVYAYIPGAEYPVKTGTNCFGRCAEIPEQPNPRRATDRELAKWLAQGNGQFTNVNAAYAWTELDVLKENEDRPCDPEWRIRKWDDDEWHEPTEDYMGLEDLA